MFSIWKTIILTAIIASQANAHQSFPQGERMVDVTRTILVRGDTSQNRMGYQGSGPNVCETGRSCGYNDVFANCCPHPDGTCCGNSLCCRSSESCCAGRCCPIANAICCHTYCCAPGNRCSGFNDNRCIPFGSNMSIRNSGCTSSLTLAYLLGLYRLYVMMSS